MKNLFLLFSVALVPLAACQSEVTTPPDISDPIEDSVDYGENNPDNAERSLEAARLAGVPEAVTFDSDLSLAENIRGEASLSLWENLLDVQGFLDQFGKDGQSATMFAPRNEAFVKVGDATLKTFLTPENRDKRIYLINEHMSDATLDTAEIKAQIRRQGGSFPITTSRGTVLTFTETDAGIKLTNPAGRSAYIVESDKLASNGVLHIIDGVLLSD